MGVVAPITDRSLLGESPRSRSQARMPNKYNAKCRFHIPKMKFWVHNWREYDAAPRAVMAWKTEAVAEILDAPSILRLIELAV